jgi:hypothetical protein
MKVLRHGSMVTVVALTVAVLAALAVVPAAIADKPRQTIIPAPDDMLITGQCAFPVLGHIEGVEIDTTFTDKAGSPVKLIGVFPGNTLTLTNLDTGTSITLASEGQFHAQLKRDGSGFVLVTGHGPSIPNPITGEPGIWYLSGRLIARFDAEGNPTSLDSTGNLVNLCERLES